MNDEIMTWQIPLRFIRDGIPLIVIPTFVNGEGPFDFILDTGNATASFVLSRRLTELLGIKAQAGDEFPAPSVVGNQPTELLAATAESVAVGPFREEQLRLCVSKAMDQLSRAIGREIDGNIGFPFLRNLRITIDYPRTTLKLAPSSLKEQTAKNSNTIPFDLGTPKPLSLVWSMVNGRGPYRFALDTGAGATIVSRELAQELILPQGAAVPIQGASGPASGFLTNLSSLNFGNVSLGETAAVAADVFSALRGPAGGKLDGIIGYNVVRQFRVTIDYPMKRMLFEQ
jgi:predicted aspartyl protease